ncbi:protein translocase subunit SecD [Candidatus Falkowbacteria bacterium]|nr:protein translocase subunit SecD [Candidatus Falkowbacteria bacterium]
MADNIFSKILKPSPRGRLWQIFIVIFILVIIGSLVDAGPYYNKGSKWLEAKTGGTLVLPKVKEIPFRLGLDLQGGTHLVYKADVSQVPNGNEASAVEGVRDVIERRVNVFGVSEPLVQVNRSAQGEYRIIAELAGISDVNEAIQMIGETPLLEFKEPGGEVRDLTEEEKASIEKFNSEADQKAEELLGKLLSGGNMEALAEDYDDRSERDGSRWITESTDPILSRAVKDLDKDSFTDIVQTNDGLVVAKLLDERTAVNQITEEEKKEVKASHLLICHQESEGCDADFSKDEAYEEIKKIKEEATVDNFDQLVRDRSDEPGASETGGDLGWFGRGQMVKPFEDTVFEQEVGTISYVVETKFGYHIIYKQDERVVKEYQVSDIFINTMNKEDITGKPDGWSNTELTGKYLKRASVQFDPNDGTPQVSLEFDAEGSKLFEQITEENVGNQVAIFLDGYIISAPTVNSKITGGQAIITGRFSLEEAKLLAQRLNAGALPVPIELISQKTVGPSLGASSVRSSLRAGIWGIILVALFMIAIYRLPGLLAVVSLTFYGILVLALFKLWPGFTLTLSGLAGFILSIGMAVDANVLIFERLKEEKRSGNDLRKSVDLAFKRAWSSIRDGNVSTLITCFILIQFSTSVVKGFALTLALGVLVSMFSAIVITKNLLLLLPEKALENKFLSGIK